MWVLERPSRLKRTALTPQQRRKRDLELKLHRAEDNVDDFKSKIEEAAQDSKLNTMQVRLKVINYLSFHQIEYCMLTPFQTYQETLRITSASYEELVISRDKLNLTAEQLIAQVKSTGQDLALAEQQVAELEVNTPISILMNEPRAITNVLQGRPLQIQPEANAMSHRQEPLV